MVHFKGFKTKKEAIEFKKKNRHGIVCGKDGPYKEDWQECIKLGGLDAEKYPYAVRWVESQF